MLGTSMMQRISISTACLLIGNLIVESLLWLLKAQLIPMADVFACAVGIVLVVGLVYFATLEASSLWYRYEREAKVYVGAFVFGILLAFI